MSIINNTGKDREGVKIDAWLFIHIFSEFGTRPRGSGERAGYDYSKLI